MARKRSRGKGAQLTGHGAGQRTFLVSGGDERGVQLWDVASASSEVLDRHSSRVRAVAVSPDQKTIASGGQEGLIHLWRPDEGREQRLTDHQSWIWSLAFSPDARWLASGGEDPEIRLWEVGTWGRPRYVAGHTHAVRALAFLSSDRLASGSDSSAGALRDRAGDLSRNRAADRVTAIGAGRFAGG